MDIFAKARNSALIGHTGFVGGALCRQTEFDYFYRSSTIADIRGKQFDCVICSAAPAQKWIANREPDADRDNIQSLISHLERVGCNRFILISTVDVFNVPVAVDELSHVDEAGLHAYGRHRRLLEKFVENQFANHLIVRLPGLVGPGLRKNAIFDFLNNNNLHAIDSRTVFQFYPIINLWYDVQVAMQQGLRLVHLTAEPISVSQVAEQGFNRTFSNRTSNQPAMYDFRTRYAYLFGGVDGYQYSARESIQAIRAYAQSEPVTLMQTESFAK